VPGTKINLQGSSKSIMDYLNIGSNGFAQIGDQKYPPQRDHLWQNIPLHSFARNK
jgi:hypothetical protein